MPLPSSYSIDLNRRRRVLFLATLIPLLLSWSSSSAHHPSGLSGLFAQPGAVATDLGDQNYYVGATLSLLTDPESYGPWVLFSPQAGASLPKGFHVEAHVPIAFSRHPMYRDGGVRGGSGLSNTLLSLHHSHRPTGSRRWLFSAGAMQWLPSVRVTVGLGHKVAATGVRASASMRHRALGLRFSLLTRVEYGSHQALATHGNITASAWAGDWLGLAVGITGSPRWVPEVSHKPEWQAETNLALVFRFGTRTTARIGATLPLMGEGQISGSMGIVVVIGPRAKDRGCSCCTSECSESDCSQKS
jgi:hypothetical protein